MLSKRVKDLKYRNFFSIFEKKRLINRFLFLAFLNNTKISKKKKLVFLYLFLKKNTNFKLRFKTKSKLNRRCIMSNRNRGVFKPYGFSRFFLREYMQFGILPGYKKAV